MIVKPGYKTTEALATAAAAIGALAAALAGHLSPKWAATAASISVGAYSLSRGLTKLGAYLGAAKLAVPAAAAPPPPAAVPAPPPTSVEG